jgi:hypothetical protein
MVAWPLRFAATVRAAEHPLAAWAKLSMVRAKVTLPNGYCGAPGQTSCEYANPCLDCRFFITTADFLDQHRRQRDETARMISDAEQAGLRRLVDEKVLHVRRQLKKLGKHHVFALPKNDTERTVPLPEWTAQSIRVHIARFKPWPCSLPWEKVNGKLRTHNLLFRWTDGEFIKSRSYSETLWKPALVTAG